MPEPHIWPLRVYYEDTDAGRIVYHASYLRFFERARTELLRSAGMDHQTLARDHRLIFAVRACNIEYLAPAKLDDMLDVLTEIRHMGASRLDMAQFIRHEGRIITKAAITVVAIDATEKAARIPDDLRQLILPHIVAPEDFRPRDKIQLDLHRSE